MHLFPLQYSIKFGFEATNLSVFLISLLEMSSLIWMLMMHDQNQSENLAQILRVSFGLLESLPHCHTLPKWEEKFIRPI